MTGHDQDRSGKCITPIPTQRETGIDQVGLMSYGIFHILSSGWLPGALGSLLFCCTESEDSSDFEFRQFQIQQQPVCSTSFRLFFSLCSMYCTLSSTVCKCTLCQQRKLHQLQTDFRGVMTPSFTFARPGHQRLLDGVLWVCHCQCHCNNLKTTTPRS